jgi:hypothetical protein
MIHCTEQYSAFYTAPVFSTRLIFSAGFAIFGILTSLSMLAMIFSRRVSRVVPLIALLPVTPSELMTFPAVPFLVISR